jgi:NHL repeat
VAASPDGTLYVGDLHGVVRVLHDGSGYEAVTAGAGVSGFSGDRHYARRAQLSGVQGVAAGPAGNVLAADYSNDRIRMVAGTTGVFYGQYVVRGDIYTIGGNGRNGFGGDGGNATSAELAAPQGLAADTAGNVLIADSANQRIRAVAASTGTFYGQAMTAGDIYTVAGNGGDTIAGEGGPVTSASLGSPRGVTVDRSGNIVAAFGDLDRVRVVAAASGTFYGQAMTASDLYTAAGNGQASLSGDSGGALSAGLDSPTGIAVDGSGDYALLDRGEVRLVPASAGTFFGRARSAGRIYGVAGTGHAGYSGDGGPARAAQLRYPGGVAFDAAGKLVIADGNNNRIRVVAGPAGTFYGRAMTAGDIYTVAGDGTGGFSGDGGPATTAQLSAPDAVAVDPAGDILAADAGNNRVRQIGG